MSKKLTTEQFIERAIKIHGDRYDYSKSNYVSFNKSIKVICNIHKEEFSTIPASHLSGKHCRKCVNDSKKENNKIKNIDAFNKSLIKTFIDINGNTYDYKLVNCKDFNDSVDIICNIHNKFSMKAYEHLSGYGCKSCNDYKIDDIKIKTGKFIIKAINKYGYNFNYSKSIYLSPEKHIIFICKDGHEFTQTPELHMSRACCKLCGEKNEITKEKFIQRSSEKFPR